MSDARPASTASPRELSPIVDGLSVHCPRCGARLLVTHGACPQCGVDPRSEAARARVVTAIGVQGELLRGAAYVARGVAAVVVRPRTWPLLAVPVLLNVVFAISANHFIVPQLANWLKWLTGPYALVDWTGWLKPLRMAIVFLGWLVRGASFLTVPGITAWVLSSPPFRVIFAATGALISERFERDVLDEGPRERFDEIKLGRSVAGAIVSSLGLMAIEAALYVVLLPVALIPLVGTFVWLIAPRLLVAGLDQTDPVLVRKMYYPREKTAIWWRHRWRVLGFGAAVLFLLGTPYANGVILAIAPVGAILLFLELDRK